ncbi:MAG: hypothetical protein Q8J77_00445, partial [Methylotenera sp.]|nr:hypothetical protein [Methylotenera sp.]
AQRSALYVIASQILSDLTGHDYDDGLSCEWHRKTNETQSLTDLNNFLVFVAMLKREIAFWQDGVKSKGKMPPKLQHYHPAAKNM